MKRKSEVVLQVLLLCAGLAFPTVAQAQRASKNQSHVFGAVSGFTGGFTEGGGISAGGGIGYERLLFKGLAAGFDFEGFGGTSHAGMVFTTNGSYHFGSATASKKLAPFGTAGFSSIGSCGDGCGAFMGMNFGGGFNYWSNGKKGFRVEFRDHVFPSERYLQMMEVRLGFSF